MENMSKKWEKRIKGVRAWPEGGTFDASMCKDMELGIKDDKPNDNRKKEKENKKSPNYSTGTIPWGRTHASARRKQRRE